MSVASQYDIEIPANIFSTSSDIHCRIVTNVLKETMSLRSGLIGSRFSNVAKLHSHREVKSKIKTSFEQMEELGLVGAIEDDKITSVNRKKNIRKLIKKQYEKESNS